MNPDELLAAQRRQPFVPFRLHVSDGSSYEIRRPEMLWFTRRTAYIGIPAAGPIPDRAVIVALIHVTRLEDLPAPAGPGNGQG